MDQLVAQCIPDVNDVLAAADAAARRGSYVAGFVTYDAAPAFDCAFAVPTSGHESLPLAWFGVFSAAEPAAPLPAPAATGAGADEWSSEIDAGTHGRAVGAIRAAVAAGDVYLVNYATRLRRPWAGGDDPFDLYTRLVSGYRGAYHAYIETDDWAVVCASPELFFERRGQRLTTRPVKGTTARGRWAEEDTDRAAALRGSEKERAENVMVVDMLRNDLGRIARPGSTVVSGLGELEQHPSLWQLTSTVTAASSADIALADVFKALFPCASVTGAPKISAMSVIADLERSRRGVYCGAVGLVTPGRRPGAEPPVARFAVAIRTAVVDKRRGLVEYGSGGGITWDSGPPAEWDEVLLKAGILTRAPAAALGPAAGLIETMGYFPGAGGGQVRNLADHLARMSASARYFGWPAPVGAEDLIAEAVAGRDRPARLRLVLRAGGDFELETFALESPPAESIALCVDMDPVDTSDIRLFHKTTDRRIYDDRAGRHPHAGDVVLINDRREVTETTRANIAVRLGDRWYTPPLECGLLPGIERARLLRHGHLTERVIHLDDLRRAPAVATLSSLRGWRAAHVLPSCPRP